MTNGRRKKNPGTKPDQEPEPAVRPSEPANPDVNAVTSTDASQTVPSGPDNGVSPGPAPVPPAGVEDEKVKAIQQLRKELGIESLERTLANMIQELQAAQQMQQVQPQNGGGLMGTIGKIAEAVGGVIQKVPLGGPTQESAFVSRLMDMMFSHYSVLDQVLLKNAALPPAPVPAAVQHIVTG